MGRELEEEGPEEGELGEFELFGMAEGEPFGMAEGAPGMPEGVELELGMPGVVIPGVMWGLSPGPGCWMEPPMGWVVCTTQTPFCLASE